MKNASFVTKTLLALVAVAAVQSFAVEPPAPATTEPAAPAGVAKSCDDLKASVAAKLDAKGVKNYTLTITPNADVKDGKVVGSCGGGTSKIVYTRG